MYKRLYGLLVSLLAFTSYASAQPTDFVGIIPLITGILGIEGNFTVVLGFLATFGFMNISVYVVFKVLFKSASEKTDMISEYDLFGGNDGRNLVAILSFLFTTAGVFGAGATGIINGFQSVIILALVMGLVAFLFIVLLGGGGVALGSIPFAGGAGARAAAKGVKEGGKQVGADTAVEYGKEKINDATNYLSRGEDEAGDGDLQSAEEDFEHTVELMREVAPRLGKDFEQMEEEIQDAYKEYLQAKSDEQDEEKRIEDISSRVKRVVAFLDTAVTGPGGLPALVVDDGSGNPQINDGSYSKTQLRDFIEGNIDPGPFEAEISASVNYPGPADGYGLAKIEEDIDAIQEDISIAEKDYEDESGNLSDGVQEFEDVIERAIRAQTLIRRMIDLLERLEEDSEEMEAIEQKDGLQKLHNASEAMISEENKLEDIISQLEDYESDIESEVEKTLGVESKVLEFDDEEIKQLKQDLKWEDGIKSAVNTLRTAFENSKGGTTGFDDDVLDSGVQITSDILDKFTRLDNEMQRMIDQFESEERNVYGRMESILGSAAENSEQNQIAKEVGQDLQDMLGKGNSRYT